VKRLVTSDGTLQDGYRALEIVEAPSLNCLVTSDSTLQDGYRAAYIAEASSFQTRAGASNDSTAGNK